MTEVYDAIGIGFGPANLALAIADAELGPAVTGAAPRLRFFEKQPRFGWHRGMLLEDATMQVSFLKDLATMRNPTSGFSFLNYLQDKGRLVDFINHKALFPSRLEFHDYLEWAAARVGAVVDYGATVVEVRPVRADGTIDELDVVVRFGDADQTQVYRTRNVVIATGLVPTVPPGVELSDRVWHSRDVLFELARLPEPVPRSFAVVGAGQSAAEVTAHLHERFPEAQVHSIFTRYGYSPADDSPFANQIFDPAAVDDYFGAPDEVKRSLIRYHANTNYSVVDAELIEELYRRLYQEQVRGERRLHFLQASRLLATRTTPDYVALTLDSLLTNQRTELQVDIAVLSTGYRSTNVAELMPAVATECELDQDGELAVHRDYRVKTNSRLRCGIYLQGPTEHTHGISSTLLSNTAVRAGEIFESIMRRTRSQAAEKVEVAEWSSVRT